MGRSRGGSRSRARRSFTPPPTPTSSTYPNLSTSTPAKPSSLGAPPPAHRSQGGGLFSGLAGTMMQGAALGTGSALAHRAVDSVMGGRGEAPAMSEAAQSQRDLCAAQSKAFADCMTANSGEISMCQFYFDVLQQCKLENP